MSSVAVIGGGITGLCAAYRLAQTGVEVKVFEASPRVGGVIQSKWSDGRLIEFGPHTILETSPLVTELIADLRLQNFRMDPDRSVNTRFVVRRGKLWPVPGGPLSLLTSGLFSPAAKLRLLAEPLIKPAPVGLEESVAQFVRRRLGAEFLDYAVDPLVAGIYAGNPEKLSVPYAFPKLREVELRYRSLILGQFLGARERRRRHEVSKQNAHKFSFVDGLQTLPDALALALRGRVETSARVTQLEQGHYGWKVTAATSCGLRHGYFDAVLLALPAHALAKIHLRAGDDLNLSPCAQIEYPPMATAALSFARAAVKNPLRGFGFLVPRRENLHILGALFSSSLFPNRAPKGEVLITAFMGGSRAPDLPGRSPEELAGLAARDLSALLGIQGEPVKYHVASIPRAIPQYNVGFGAVKDWMRQTEKSAPGLYFAGPSCDGISVADCIVSAEKAARTLRAFLAQSASTARPEPKLAAA
jgi:oxygen-dependent protoporphyrinogen oxidase